MMKETWENRELHIGDMFVQAFDRETREAKETYGQRKTVRSSFSDVV